MKKENCTRKKIEKNKTKTVTITIRLTQKLSAWLKKENLSPTGIFNEAVKELGYRE